MGSDLFLLTGGTKIGGLESVLLQKVLLTVTREQTDSKQLMQALLKEDITYEELEVLLNRDQKTRHLSKNLQEKLEQSECIKLSRYRFLGATWSHLYVAQADCCNNGICVL